MHGLEVAEISTLFPRLNILAVVLLVVVQNLVGGLLEEALLDFTLPFCRNSVLGDW